MNPEYKCNILNISPKWFSMSEKNFKIKLFFFSLDYTVIVLAGDHVYDMEM